MSEKEFIVFCALAIVFFVFVCMVWRMLDLMSDGWQPIETAPKDGTTVDLWVYGQREGCRVTECHYSQSKDCWFVSDCRLADYFISGSVSPTHWMRPPGAPRK